LLFDIVTYIGFAVEIRKNAGPMNERHKSPPQASISVKQAMLSLESGSQNVPYLN